MLERRMRTFWANFPALGTRAHTAKRRVPFEISSRAPYRERRAS